MLPGLKQNLQGMRSAAQLQQLVSHDKIVDQNKQEQRNNTSLAMKDNINLQTIKEKLTPSKQVQSTSQLPPRQPSNLRNGVGPGSTRNAVTKLKTSTTTTSQANGNYKQLSQVDRKKLHDYQTQINQIQSPKGLIKDVMAASERLQMLDLNDNMNLVGITNHKSLNKMMKQNSTNSKDFNKHATQPSEKIIQNVNARVKEIEYLSRDKSKIIVDLAPQVKVQAQTLADDYIDLVPNHGLSSI